ncbi:MAG TPA: AI-2E family transporter [Thermoleophilaceae bacterium]|nr:AI-2E family transporter [Thermoleophilaceae bacterium]
MADQVAPQARDAGSLPSRVEIVVSGATVLKTALIALGVYVAIVASEVLLTVGLAFVFALGLDPLVTWFTRRGMGRGKAALLVFLLLFLILAVIVIWAATPVWDEIKQLVNELPSYVEDLKDEPLFNELHNNTDAVDKAQEVAKDAAKAIPEAASALLGITGALVGSVLSIVTLVFLTLFLLIGLPDFKTAGLALLPPRDAARVDRVLGEVTETISYSLLGNIAISVIAGTVVGITAAIVGAPFPIVLAVIVGLFDLIPQVGSLIAAVIVVAITLAGAGLAPAVAMAVVILIYQQVENYVIQPLVYRKAVELSGFATIAVVMIGGALMGVIGAILAVPVAASLKVVLRELTAARRERLAAGPIPG